MFSVVRMLGYAHGWLASASPSQKLRTQHTQVCTMVARPCTSTVALLLYFSVTFIKIDMSISHRYSWSTICKDLKFLLFMCAGRPCRSKMASVCYLPTSDHLHVSSWLLPQNTPTPTKVTVLAWKWSDLACVMSSVQGHTLEWGVATEKKFSPCAQTVSSKAGTTQDFSAGFPKFPKTAFFFKRCP